MPSWQRAATSLPAGAAVQLDLTINFIPGEPVFPGAIPGNPVSPQQLTGAASFSIQGVPNFVVGFDDITLTADHPTFTGQESPGDPVIPGNPDYSRQSGFSILVCRIDGWVHHLCVPRRRFDTGSTATARRSSRSTLRASSARRLRSFFRETLLRSTLRLSSVAGTSRLKRWQMFPNFQHGRCC